MNKEENKMKRIKKKRKKKKNNKKSINKNNINIIGQQIKLKND